MSDIIHDFKKFTARKIIDAIINGTRRKEWMLKKFAFAGNGNSNNTTYQFWQPDYYAVELSTKLMWDQRVQYIHYNPVRAGIVDMWKIIFIAALDFIIIKNACCRLVLFDVCFSL